MLLLAVLFPGLLSAQQTPDYTLLLNSGKFIPLANSQTITRDSEIFRKSLFGDKHYLTIQFQSLPNQETKGKLAAAGITLIDYLPNFAYTATVKAGFNPEKFKAFAVRSVIQLAVSQKTVPAFLKGDFPAHAVPKPGYVDVTLTTYETLSAPAIAKSLQKTGAVILDEMPMFRTFTIRVPQNQILKLIELSFVQWAEPIDAPNTLENLPGRSLHRVNQLNDGVRNLKGNGIKVGIWDGGEVSPHTDFSPVASRLRIMEPGTPESHPTHVAGTIGGRGIINPKARGMAPNAELYSYNFSGSITTEMFNAIPALNLDISSHSYGSTQTCGVNGAGVAYSTTSRNTDVNLNTYPSHLHVHSAGNSQTACTGGWSTITGSGKTAKNNIVVANITSTEGINSSSSFGPVADGRVKPEISAMGTNVLSTYTPLNNYGTISGTSMATPGVSGTLALLVERYKQLQANALPISSLIKAVTCNTAHDLGNPGPDYKFGFGRLNGLAAVKALEQSRYAINTITTGATNDITIPVPAGTVKLKVMLAWNDPAGTANANPALVNNLDLVVINGTVTTLPWKLNPASPATAATRGIDNVSNIEQVTLDNPAAGSYTFRVFGAAVPSGANQQYSLTWEVVQPFLEITYPNGAESFSPGTSETITWDNAGVTGNQTIQYSLNNGTTWTTLSTTIPAGTTRYTWNIPATLAASGTALIKVSSGTLSDQSDANFSVLRTPASLSTTTSICPGSLTFTWPAIPGVTHYDILQLDGSNGQWNVLAPNVTGTTYTASGLTPGSSYWFTLVAKNNTLGAVSDRALAINRTISSSTSLALSAITGPARLCTGGQNQTYSVTPVAGITNYIWTVPAGASIISGQGTSNLVVNYGTGSVNGIISVSGTASSCQTAITTLAVSVASPVSPPVSGGDQVICGGVSGGMLTATATVPAGHSLRWYTSASGGNSIGNPELRNPGTITYYAASVTQNGGCESLTRTPVTLTINTAPQPAIVSNGSTTFCQGEAITLTASSGTAFLWSTGENTQAISVNKGGAYSVTTWQANGCSATSVPAVITVNPKPVITLTAAPYTSLYPGLTSTLTAVITQGTPATFTWMKNGIVVPGATKASLPVSVDELGTYAVTITNKLGCTATSNPLTISDSASATVFMYPNPNNGRFQIRYNNAGGSPAKNSVLIYDARGALIASNNYTVTMAYERMEIDLKTQASGLYLVILKNEAGREIASGRVIVHTSL